MTLEKERCLVALYWVLTGCSLGACAREEKDVVVMFIYRGAQCESMVVEQMDHHILVQGNVASMKETRMGCIHPI